MQAPDFPLWDDVSVFMENITTAHWEWLLALEWEEGGLSTVRTGWQTTLIILFWRDFNRIGNCTFQFMNSVARIYELLINVMQIRTSYGVRVSQNKAGQGGAGQDKGQFSWGSIILITLLLKLFTETLNNIWICRYMYDPPSKARGPRGRNVSKYHVLLCARICFC